ncbi:Uncharacterized protein APZ42_005310, partial [Daphnia magna]
WSADLFLPIGRAQKRLSRAGAMPLACLLAGRTLGFLSSCANGQVTANHDHDLEHSGHHRPDLPDHCPGLCVHPHGAVCQGRDAGVWALHLAAGFACAAVQRAVTAQRGGDPEPELFAGDGLGPVVGAQGAGPEPELQQHDGHGHVLPEQRLCGLSH